jgi:hypothetical protein
MPLVPDDILAEAAQRAVRRWRGLREQDMTAELAEARAKIEQLRHALEYARPMVVGWGREQGHPQEYVDETMRPINEALEP